MKKLCPQCSVFFKNNYISYSRSNKIHLFDRGQFGIKKKSNFILIFIGFTIYIKIMYNQ